MGNGAFIYVVFSFLDELVMGYAAKKDNGRIYNYIHARAFLEGKK